MYAEGDDDDSDLGLSSPRYRIAFRITVFGFLMLITGMLLIIGPIVVYNANLERIRDYLIAGAAVGGAGVLFMASHVVWCCVRRLRARKDMRYATKVAPVLIGLMKAQISIAGPLGLGDRPMSNSADDAESSASDAQPRSETMRMSVSSAADDGGFLSHTTKRRSSPRRTTGSGTKPRKPDENVAIISNGYLPSVRLKWHPDVPMETPV